MNPISRILLWLAFFAACFLPAPALTPTAPENSVWEIFSTGYDAPTAEATDLGNRTETPTSNYDTAPIHSVVVEKIPTEADRTFFCQNAEFKAAEGGESFVFRGDRSSVTPEQVFQNGFTSKGDNMDLLAHVTQPLPDSGFVATSESQEIATGFAGKNGYTFTIRNNGTGLNVNSTLGGASPFPEQLEVAFPRNIPAEDIFGATSKRTGEFIPNPNYGGSR